MAKSVGLPIHYLPDGREFITGMDIADRPEVAAFVERFPDYWTRDPMRDGVYGPTSAERKKLNKQGYLGESTI